jgi:hypothetical protein
MTHSAADDPMNPEDDDLVIEESSLSANPSSPASAPTPRPKVVEPLPLEMEEPAGNADAAPSKSVHAGRPIDVEVEPAAQVRKSSYAKTLDLCPSCGANMPGPNELVCLRCGFDLKTMKKVRTVTGETEVSDEEADAGESSGEHKRAISAPGKGDLWLPGAMAGIAGLILIIAYLSGWPGLFAAGKVSAEGVVAGGDRFLGLLRLVVMAGMMTGCGVAALAFVAHLLGMKLGDLKLTAIRMVGIVLTMQLVTLLDFNSRVLEWLVEAVGQVGVFTGLSLAFFRISPRDLLQLAAAGVIIFLLLWLGGNVIVWATASAV